MILVNPVFRQAPSRNNTWFRRMKEAAEKAWRDGSALLSSCSRSKMDAYDNLVYYRHYHHYHHFHHYYYYCWPVTRCSSVRPCWPVTRCSSLGLGGLLAYNDRKKHIHIINGDTQETIITKTINIEGKH